MNRKKQILYSHRNKDFFDLRNDVYAQKVLDFFERALADDLGSDGDITSLSVVPGNAMGSAYVVARENGIVAGLEEVKFFLKNRRKMLWNFKVKLLVEDGSKVGSNDKVMKIEASARDLLAVERTVLNFIQRLSGIATYTADMVKKVPPGVLICPTRKTLWGVLDKKGALVGGGGTHRLNLSDAILIKSNHAVFTGGLAAAISKLKNVHKGRFVEVEVRNQTEAIVAAELLVNLYPAVGKERKPPIMMFDNFTADKIKDTIKKIKEKGFYDDLLFEASGGINKENIKQFASCGTDILSLGSITHSSRALDFSMKIEPLA